MDGDLDKRGSPRVRADYAVEYLIAGKGADGRGRSVDLSESGIRFVCKTRLSPGAYLMVRVPPRGVGMPALTRQVSVVRCKRLEDGSGFAVGCAYD